MIDGCTLILDVGKTHAKLSLWDAQGTVLDRRVRVNPAFPVSDYRVLDIEGIERWLFASIFEIASQCRTEGPGRIRRIIPVGHGAAAALLRGEALHAPPMDYETEADPGTRSDYAAQRSAFADTGSPFLPCALNLGLQLHLLEFRLGPLPDDVTILPWPQYWAWRLSGVMASELTSLGCHSDLWRPTAGDFSELAKRRGWAQRLAPVRQAAEVLGTVTPAIAAATGLPADCDVLCGLHDSNAALLAARGHAAIADNESTVLSTGTWFVAMRTPAPGTQVDVRQLDEARDCLVNVDVHGRPVPSARFMGGREAELAGSIDSFALTKDQTPARLLDRIPAVLTNRVMACPTFVPGVGPFPDSPGRWRRCPDDPLDKRVATCLYLALMADATLDLVGSREHLLIEGRFAEEVVFVRALAALRPDQCVYVSNAHNDVAYGALRLVDPALAPPGELTPVAPLDIDLSAYAADWHWYATEAAA